MGDGIATHELAAAVSGAAGLGTIGSHGPGSMQFQLAGRLAAIQSPGRPFFGPGAALAGGPASLVDAGPLYAGESAKRISDVRPAAEVVRALAG